MIPTTPTTPDGLRIYDGLPPNEAIRLAWTRAGRAESHHAAAQAEVRRIMPVLASALDRLVST